MNSFRLSVLSAVTAAAAVLPVAALAQAPGGAAAPPPAVSVLKVQSKTIPVAYEYAGRVAASRQVEVRARVGGILLDRAFEEGARVAPNQVLFRIDAQQYEAEVALARAQVQQQQATLSQARRTEDRSRALTRSGAVSTATLDDAVSARELAEAQVAAAEAQLQTANLSLQYATVKAPVGGITSLEQVPEGSLISVNALLTQISQLDPIYVNFSAADTEAEAIRRLIENGAASGKLNDLTVKVSFGDGSVYGQTGSIDFTSSSIDTETGTILSRAILANPKNQLLPGQFVRVAINGLTLDDAIVIPAKALMQGAQGTFVYTVDEKSLAQIRPIKLGREVGTDIVVTDGLKNGDRIITEGVIKVRPNAPVNAGEPAATGPAGAAKPGVEAKPDAPEAQGKEAPTSGAATAATGASPAAGSAASAEAAK